MELDLSNFEWDRTDENLEWWIFNAKNSDFFITINKENLSKVLNWEELKIELYRSWEQLDFRELEKWVRKELTLCLIPDNERNKKLEEALPIDNEKESEKVRIEISKGLINELLNYEWKISADYGQRYGIWWNKMHFYVTESFERDWLKDQIDFYKKVYDITYPKDKQ